MVKHQYLSTGCLHGHHHYCGAMVGWQGAKRPARCKFCDAMCECSCHVADAELDGDTYARMHMRFSPDHDIVIGSDHQWICRTCDAPEDRP